jgi:fucose permease
VPLLLLAFIAFIGLGLPDPMPGSLWPSLRPHYGVPNAALGLVLAAVATGYVAAGLLTARMIASIGIGGVLVGSLAATTLAAAGQALAPPWAGFVALAVLAGFGGGAVDSAMNLFAASRFKPGHMNWLHGFWGVGATIGPATAAALLAAGFGWQAGYAAVALALGALTLCFLATRGRWEDDAPRPAAPRGHPLAVLRNPVARLQVAIFFLYTGLEAGAGQWVATIMTAARGATPAEGAIAATLFFACITGGRLGLGFVVDRIGADRVLRLLTPVAMLALLAFALGVADLLALAVVAVALAPIFPTLMARTPARVGAGHAAQAVGLQVAAATIGVAVIPAALGLGADLAGAGIVPWLLSALGLVLSVLVWRLPAKPVN